MGGQTIADIGEKRIIAEFIRPLFNKSNDVAGVGDDCAMVNTSDGETWLFSTDRVPADLIAFRLGILDFTGFGRYLTRLNLSDIAACGGRPVALLLNLAFPSDLQYDNLKELCTGVAEVATNFDCLVLGGDISASSEISISATSIGRVKRDKVLTRRGATPGDTIFISRPLGLTPAAFAFFLRNNLGVALELEHVNQLKRQFTALEPLINLGQLLADSLHCTSCMDNTDGIGQSLLELSVASGAKFVLDRNQLVFPDVVHIVARASGENVVDLALGAGADFSLVGTLKGSWSQGEAKMVFGSSIKLIGSVEPGDGLYLMTDNSQIPINPRGWNYFLNK